jgi:hypothetical protein
VRPNTHRDRVGIPIIRALAGLSTALCFAVFAPAALAVEPGKITNPCVAHAVATPGLYGSLKAMNQACDLPAGTPSASPPSAPGTVPTGVAAPAATPCDYCSYYIYSGDSENVINAKGCFTTTVLFTYPVSSGCEGGANEIWEIVALSTGYRALIAYYKGTTVCMTAGPASGQNAGTQPCTDPVQSYMEFRRPVVSESCVGGWYYIIPAANYGLSLNVQGGLGEGRNIISYSKGCYDNSIWYYG